jgi:hypothetical protein
MSFVSKQTKGSGILTFMEGKNQIIVIIKHITKIKFEPDSVYSGYSYVRIYTLESKYSTDFKIAKSDEQALIDFIRSEQNLVKPTSNTTKILTAAGLV